MIHRLISIPLTPRAFKYEIDTIVSCKQNVREHLPLETQIMLTKEMMMLWAYFKVQFQTFCAFQNFKVQFQEKNCSSKFSIL